MSPRLTERIGNYLIAETASGCYALAHVKDNAETAPEHIGTYATRGIARSIIDQLHPDASYVETEQLRNLLERANRDLDIVRRDFRELSAQVDINLGLAARRSRDVLDGRVQHALDEIDNMGEDTDRQTLIEHIERVLLGRPTH